MEHKHHEESTLRTEEQGIVARCECGWVSGWHFSASAASAALMDHRERAKQTPMERSTGNRKYLREEDCEDNDEGA